MSALKIHGVYDIYLGQVGGFAPIGMVECWNIGKMGLANLQYWVNGKFVLTIKFKMDYIL
jgi:hypothetical protein